MEKTSMGIFQDLERRLAYSAARSDIELCCEAIMSDDGLKAEWYRLDTAKPEDGACITDAIKYLDGRCLLIHHPDVPNWVNFLDAD